MRHVIINEETGEIVAYASSEEEAVDLAMSLREQTGKWMAAYLFIEDWAQIKRLYPPAAHNVTFRNKIRHGGNTTSGTITIPSWAVRQMDLNHHEEVEVTLVKLKDRRPPASKPLNYEYRGSSLRYS